MKIKPTVMKQIRTAVILMTLVLGGLTSCTKDNNGTAAVSTTSISNTSTTSPGKVNGKGVIASTLEQARWRVSSYSGMSQNGTDFTGFEFTFVDGGYVAAIYGEMVYNGSWAANDATYNLLLDWGVTTPPLSNLNGEWHIVQLSTETISLQRVNGTASFTFQKTHDNAG